MSALPPIEQVLGLPAWLPPHRRPPRDVLLALTPAEAMRRCLDVPAQPEPVLVQVRAPAAHARDPAVLGYTAGEDDYASHYMPAIRVPETDVYDVGVDAAGSGPSSSDTDIIGPDMWLIDSGSVFDIISMHDLPSSHIATHSSTTEYRVELNTIGGPVFVDLQISVPLPSTNETVHPFLVPSGPAVLSLGRRCREGWHFQWGPNGPPILTQPDGLEHVLHVHRDVPYLRATASRPSAPPYGAPCSLPLAQTHPESH